MKNAVLLNTCRGGFGKLFINLLIRKQKWKNKIQTLLGMRTLTLSILPWLGQLN